MPVLIGIALKSLLIAGATLGVLQLMKNRSAAERSWVAHIGLLALVVMAFAPLVVPSWTIETPALFGQPVEQQVATPQGSAVSAVTTFTTPVSSTIRAASAKPAPGALARLNAVQAAVAIYALPAAALLFVTFLALARLVTLRARADVLVDGHWLSALARAQKRMGFKHGTALLTSDELASPISWGLMRPVILLNSRAVEASGEAEAIIAHELAHVARMDWIKLLLARVATALFWFNPLVWVLAREAHQLREESADDTVLSADIPDTDYAELLVGVARHECPGLLLGAHGVAPSKSSLARRVARVLDGKSVRGPVARSFGLGVFVGAIAIAAPLAALSVTPKGAKLSPSQPTGSRLAASEPSCCFDKSAQVATDLPHIISQGVATSVQTAVAAIQPKVTLSPNSDDFEAVAPSGASVRQSNGITVARSPNGATVTTYPPDAQGRRKVVARSQNGATAVTYIDAGDEIPGMPRMHKKDSVLDRAVEMKAVGLTPEYVAAMRAAAPKLRGLDTDEFVGMKAVGVTPDYVRDLASVGFADLDEDDLTSARAVGVTSAYVRTMRAAGYNGALEDFVSMRAVGVTPGYADQFRKVGYQVPGAKQLVRLKAHDINVDDLRNLSQPPPLPPPPPSISRSH